MKTVRILLWSLLAVLAVVSIGFYDSLLEAQQPPVTTRTLFTGVASTTLSTDTLMLSAPTNSMRYYIRDVVCVNTSATPTIATIKDGTTGIMTITCPPSSGIAGMRRFDPPFRQPTANTAINMAATTGVSTAYFSIRAYLDR